MPARLFSDTIDPVRRSDAKELFLVRVEAAPLPDNPESSECGGAFVNAWVNVPTLREAERAMLARLGEEGWRPVRLDHWEIVCRR